MRASLSAGATDEISAVQQAKADGELKKLLEQALIERDRAEADTAKLRRTVAAVRRALADEDA